MYLYYLTKHTYIYKCMSVCVEECIFGLQVVIKASFIKDDGTLFVYDFRL